MSSENDPDGEATESHLDPSLAERLRRFEERMRARPERPQVDEQRGPEAGFVPKTPSQQEVLSFLDETKGFLRGTKKIQYLGTVTGWEHSRHREDGDLHHYPTSLAIIHANLDVFRKVPEKDRVELLASLLDNKEYITTLVNFFHWLWLVEEVPWTSEDLSEDERKLIEELRKAAGEMLLSDKTLQRREVLIKLGEAMDDMVLAQSVTINCSRALPEYSDEKLLEETAFTGNPWRMVAQALDLTTAELRNCTLWGECLDVGSGFSDFPFFLRIGGATIYTLDELSVPELKAKIRRLIPAGMIGPEALAFHEMPDRDLEAWHRKGSASDIPKIFGEGKFRRIFACDSITQPALFPIFKKDPMVFWNNIYGCLRGLHPNGGELRTNGLPMFFLYTPALMEKVIVPFLAAIQMGGFEIPDCYDTSGKFSFEKFMANYVTWTKTSQRPLTIRRHLDSNPEESDRVMRRMLADDEL